MAICADRKVATLQDRRYTAMDTSEAAPRLRFARGRAAPRTLGTPEPGLWVYSMWNSEVPKKGKECRVLRPKLNTQTYIHMIAYLRALARAASSVRGGA